MSTDEGVFQPHLAVLSFLEDVWRLHIRPIHEFTDTFRTALDMPCSKNRPRKAAQWFFESCFLLVVNDTNVFASNSLEPLNYRRNGRRTKKKWAASRRAALLVILSTFRDSVVGELLDIHYLGNFVI